MMKKINVALCISGEPRSSMMCYPYIAESFIFLDPDYYNVHVYIHSRKNYRALFLYNPKKYYLDDMFTTRDIWDSKNIKLPKELNNDYNFYSHYTQNSSFLENQLLMLDGIIKCFKLTSPDVQKYDLYIRCRSDFYMESQIRLDSITRDIVVDKKYDMVIPSKGIMSSIDETDSAIDEYNDQLAIGNFKSMSAYCSTGYNLNYLINKTKKFKVEKWLKEQLDDKKIKVSTPYLPLVLIRGTRIYSNRGYNGFDHSFLDE